MNTMTQAAEEERRRRGTTKLPCSSLSEPFVTEGMTVNDETCTLSKFFSGYFLAVAMALTVLLIFLWFSWGRRNKREEMAEIIKLVLEQLQSKNMLRSV